MHAVFTNFSTVEAEVENDQHYYSNEHNFCNLTMLRPVRKLLLVEHCVKQTLIGNRLLPWVCFKSTLLRLPLNQ